MLQRHRLSGHCREPVRTHVLRAWLGALLSVAALGVSAQENKNLAPGFTELPANAKILVTPIDIELYSISGGGVAEPRADWTAAAQANMKKELGRLREKYKGQTIDLDERTADEFGELLTLHSAVARSINLHHGVGGIWALPTKEGKLDWSFGDALRPLQEKTGARYALFVWVRDSYASAERVAAMVLMAALGVGLSGGSQQGYASLVDLQTGQVLWFNHLARVSGDLRDAAKSAETVDVLLTGFPAAR